MIKIMNKKIEAMILFSVFVGFIGFSSLFFSGISFSEDDFKDVDFFYWKQRLIESKDSKDGVLLEMLGKAVGKPDGFTFAILQNHGPRLFCGKPEENPNDNTVFQNNKRDFQRLLLNLFKTHDLAKFRSFYGIKDGESDLHVARVFEIVFFLYVPEIGFSYQLRENLKETLSWGWNDNKAPELLAKIIKSMEEFLGPKVSYHVRARVKNIQSVGGIEEVVVVVQWELVEVENSYNPQKDALEATEKVIEKSAPVREFLSKEEAAKIKGDYGTKNGLPLERDAAIALFQSLSKTSKIFENPSPREIGSSNWKLLSQLETPQLETRMTTTGAVFTRDRSHDKLNEAWRDPSGLIWGDVVKNENGSVRHMVQSSEHMERIGHPLSNRTLGAKEYCESIDARLPSKEEFIRLREYMGARSETNEGYSAQVLPNLSDYWFWSSSVGPSGADGAHYFGGSNGGIYGGHRYVNGAVRCVVAR